MSPRTTNIIFGVLLSVVAATLASAQPGKTGGSASESGFASALAAVQAATQHYKAVSVATGRTFSGPVFKRNSRFHYEVFSEKSGSSSLPTAAKLVALWYTHDGDAQADKFLSSVHAVSAKRWNIPVFAAQTSGVLRMHAPASAKLAARQGDSIRATHNWRFARGTSVVTLN